MSSETLGSPGPAGERPTADARDGQPVPGVDPELLERVLQQTLLGDTRALLGDGGAVAADPRVVAALKQVVERHRGRAFELDPLVVELVEAALGEPYRRLVGEADAWRAMTHSIAQTLYDDPPSYDRLQALWRRLDEADA